MKIDVDIQILISCGESLQTYNCQELIDLKPLNIDFLLIILYYGKIKFISNIIEGPMAKGVKRVREDEEKIQTPYKVPSTTDSDTGSSDLDIGTATGKDLIVSVREAETTERVRKR